MSDRLRMLLERVLEYLKMPQDAHGAQALEGEMIYREIQAALLGGLDEPTEEDL